MSSSRTDPTIENYRISEDELEFLADYLETTQDIHLARAYSREDFIDELERAFRFNGIDPNEYQVSLENLSNLTRKKSDFLHRVINQFPEWKDENSAQLEKYRNGNEIRVFDRTITKND